MKNLFKLFIVILLFSCSKNEESQEQDNQDTPQEQINQDALVSGFLDLIIHYQVYCVIN